MFAVTRVGYAASFKQTLIKSAISITYTWGNGSARSRSWVLPGLPRGGLRPVPCFETQVKAYVYLTSR